jgi:oligosaccharyltransferase complex subunit gamma
MRLPTLSFTAAFCILATAVRASVQDDFLVQANAAPDGVIKLDSAGYDKLVSSSPSSPRNYSVTVVLTALPSQYKCQPCQCVRESAGNSRA